MRRTTHRILGTIVVEVLTPGPRVAGPAAAEAIATRAGMDNPDIWRWIWLGAAVALGVGEIATMGLFLLPFAIGALAAGLCAFLGAALAVQLVAFAAVSLVVFAAFRPLAHRLDQSSDDRGVGARRLVGATGVVLEEVDHAHGGMVRIGTEEWRAVAVDDAPIPPGTAITVREIKGTRAVVEPAD
jgi:membrane protein implicated in regulation of membrane protease activity